MERILLLQAGRIYRYESWISSFSGPVAASTLININWIGNGNGLRQNGFLEVQNNKANHYELRMDIVCKWTLIRKYGWLAHIQTGRQQLTHWGRVAHICVSKLTIIGSDTGLLPGRRQTIIWTDAAILFIRTLGTIFSEIVSKNSYIFIRENAFEYVVCEMLAILSRPQCVDTEFLGPPWLTWINFNHSMYK